MDLFKMLGDWLGGGKKKEEKKVVQRPQQTRPVQQPSLGGVRSMSSFQQPTAPKPTAPVAPKVEQPKVVTSTPQIQQPKMAVPNLADQAQQQITRNKQVQEANKAAAQKRLNTPQMGGKPIGQQNMPALKGQTINDYVNKYNQSDSDTQRSLKTQLEKQRDFYAPSVSSEGRALHNQTKTALDNLDRIGQTKSPTLKGIAQEVGKFAGDVAKGAVNAAGAPLSPVVTGVMANQSRDRFNKGEINADQYSREVSNAVDGAGGYYFRKGIDQQGYPTLLQPHQKDDGTRRGVVESTVKQAQAFTNAGIDAGLTASGILNAPANVAKGLAGATTKSQLIKSAAPALKEAGAYQATDMANQVVQGNNPLDPTFLASSLAGNALLPLGGYAGGAIARKATDAAASRVTSKALDNPALRNEIINTPATPPKVPTPQITPAHTPEATQVRTQAVEKGIVTPETKMLSPQERVATAINSTNRINVPAMATSSDSSVSARTDSLIDAMPMRTLDMANEPPLRVEDAIETEVSQPRTREEMLQDTTPPVEAFGPAPTFPTIELTAAKDFYEGMTKRNELDAPVEVERPPSIGEIIDQQQHRVGEQFAKPNDALQMSQGKITEQPGFIASESPSGERRRRVVMNPETGRAESIIETREPDGNWVVQKEPAVEHKADHQGIESVENNEDLNRIARQAIEDGNEIHLYADKNTGDTKGSAVHEFDPERHTIDGGLVRDANNGAIIGNHIKIDDTGIAMNIGKDMVNMTTLVGDPGKWKNLRKVTYTMDRLLEQASPDPETYRKIRSFIIEHKQKAEGQMREELAAYRKNLENWRSDLLDVRPGKINKKEFQTDIFHFAERKLAQLEKGKALTQEQLLEQKYGKEVAGKIQAFDKWAREQYDSLLDRTNEVLRAFGHDEVPKRENYMTHLQEDSFWDAIGIGEDLYRDLSSGINGEALNSSRGALPGNIAGLSEDFRPTKKYNPFHQARRGSDSATDPFRAMDAYGEAAQFNIHMTESAVRARSLESVFRAAEEVVNKDMLKHVNSDLRSTLKPSLDGKRGALVKSFQEYANALSGKSSVFDRAVLDVPSGNKALKLARLAQRVAAQSSIIGNVSVTVAQTLNLPNVIGTNGTRNVVKGLARQVKDMKPNGEPKIGTPASRSDFLKVRYTDAQSKIQKSKFQKLNDKVSTITFMPIVERGMVELAWQSSYEKALAGKFKGTAAIKEADRLTERLVAGRGIADQPEIYRTVIGKTFLQYTLEVNSTLKNVTKDLSPYGVVKYALAVYVLNHAIQGLTGRAPLPDFMDASLDTAGDFMTDKDEDGDGKADRNVGDKLKSAGQRYSSETAKLNPILSAFANLLGTQDAKKAVFGEDSDQGRYDGAPAVGGMLSSLAQAGYNAASGNLGKALDQSMAGVPYGSQLRKSTGGIQTALQGYATSGNDKVTTGVDANPFTVIQAALFGKNAIPEVKAYYANKNSPLSDTQQEIFNTIKESGGNAIDYANAKFAARSVEKPSGDTASAATKELAEVEAEKKVKLASGDWKEENGYIVNKSGDIQREYYKDKAAGSTKKDDSTYEAYLKGFDLEENTKYGKKKDYSTGSGTLDSLLDVKATKGGSSLASKSVALYSDTDKYDKVPDWVKERYYKEAGFDKKQVEYAAIASIDATTKLDNYYRPIAEKADHKALMDELTRGRRQSIQDNKLQAQDSVITSLQKEGYLSKDEAKYLKSIKLDWDGKETKESEAARSSSGGGRGRKGKGKGKGKGSGYTGADISKFVASSGSGYSADIQRILAAARTGGKTKGAAVTARKPTMRSLAPKKSSMSRGGSKLSKTALG